MTREGSSWSSDKGYPILWVYVKTDSGDIGAGFRAVHFVKSNGVESVLIDTTGERLKVKNDLFTLCKVFGKEHEINDNGHLLIRNHGDVVWTDWGPFSVYDEDVSLRASAFSKGKRLKFEDIEVDDLDFDDLGDDLEDL